MLYKLQSLPRFEVFLVKTRSRSYAQFSETNFEVVYISIRRSFFVLLANILLQIWSLEGAFVAWKYGMDVLTNLQKFIN